MDFQERDRMSWAIIFLLSLMAIAGCQGAQTAAQPAKTPEVLVSMPISQQVAEFEEYTGRTEAVMTVNIRARVTGYLDKVSFKEGSDVKQRDPLFEIDPRSYQAEVDRAEANVVQAEAHFKRLDTDYRRAVSLLSRKAISQEEVDKIAGDRGEAEAAVGVAKAGRDLAQLNLNFTKVMSPIAGRISRRLIDPGNMVKADDTILTTIVSIDPIYASFDVNERDLLRIRRLIQEGKMQSARKEEVPVQMGLSDEEEFPHAGSINFVENRVDPMTGTLRVRGVFSNPHQLLSPGLFVRVRVRTGPSRAGLMVAEQALGTDQSQRYIYVVNPSNIVEYRRVSVGPLNQGLRVIETGLRPDDKVIVSGLQRVRPKSEVVAKVITMPGAAPDAATKRP